MPRYWTVIFDCDSTLSALEGIEELAAEHRAEVAALTDAAMRGAIPLEEVYGRRLALASPTRDQVEALGRRYIEALVPDARETVAALRAEGIDVRILSGGLLPAIRILARHLGLDDDAVAAVDLYFDAEGRYTGYDAGSPLAYAGGKRVMIERWAPGLRRPVLLVGDGATDLEAKPVVDAFVAFAGVVERPAVVQAADVVVRARSLAPILPIALGGPPPRNSAALEVFSRGMSYIDDPDDGPAKPE
jgi:phosphoserine phosphatase